MVQRSNKKQLKPYRKELRNKSTSAEAELWNNLKGKQLDGRKFRRQQSINNYIVDFYCTSEKLIIELDGESHGSYQKTYEDEDRDNDLRRMGYRILRFENRSVFEDIEWIRMRSGEISAPNHPTLTIAMLCQGTPPFLKGGENYYIKHLNL